MTGAVKPAIQDEEEVVEVRADQVSLAAALQLHGHCPAAVTRPLADREATSLSLNISSSVLDGVPLTGPGLLFGQRRVFGTDPLGP